MAGRASVWSDPEVLALARRAVACADEVWRLQRGDDDECRVFQGMADAGHYSGKGGTRQGIYLATPAGELLASCNALNPEAVLTMLERGFHAWEQLPPEARARRVHIDRRDIVRWEDSCPDDGLVLTSFVRDLPDSLQPSDAQGRRWNRDHAWFSRDEARDWLPATPRPGSRFEVPWRLVARLARFHVIDNVRGQGLPFATEEVAGSQIHGEVLSVDGPRVRLAYEGLTRAVADGTWRLGDNDWTPSKPWPRGHLTQVLGWAVFDLEAGRFTEFELQAHGVRWGQAPVNGRHGDPGPAPIGTSFSLAGDAPADRVAPAFIDVYDADWVVAP